MTTKYRCISDEWDPQGTELYDSPQDFLEMCQAVHDELPELRLAGDVYRDRRGRMILEPVEVTE